jgi:hypothetical protein
MRTFFIILVLGLLGFAIYFAFDSFVTNQGAYVESEQNQERREQYENEFGEIDRPGTYQEGALDIGREFREWLGSFTGPKEERKPFWEDEAYQG